MLLHHNRHSSSSLCSSSISQDSSGLFETALLLAVPGRWPGQILTFIYLRKSVPISRLPFPSLLLLLIDISSLSTTHCQIPCLFIFLLKLLNNKEGERSQSQLSPVLNGPPLTRVQIKLLSIFRPTVWTAPSPSISAFLLHPCRREVEDKFVNIAPRTGTFQLTISNALWEEYISAAN